MIPIEEPSFNIKIPLKGFPFKHTFSTQHSNLFSFDKEKASLPFYVMVINSNCYTGALFPIQLRGMNASLEMFKEEAAVSFSQLICANHRRKFHAADTQATTTGMLATVFR